MTPELTRMFFDKKLADNEIPNAVTAMYKIIQIGAIEEFPEKDKESINTYLRECFEDSLKD
jgi:hypothetical protein